MFSLQMFNFSLDNDFPNAYNQNLKPGNNSILMTLGMQWSTEQI